MPTLTYATRKSLLALAQCRAFCAALKEKTPDLELVEEQVVTSGDRIQDRPLSEVGGKGLFVKEIEEALFAGRADFAVHSIKDVPGFLPPGLALVCIPLRADPRDALVAPKDVTLAALPKGAKVGTSSLRRLVALRRARPDLDIVPVRGNVDTRLRKVDAGEYDAIVLARAGLVRLGLEARATEVLSAEQSLPAVGQGALGIECRADDAKTRDVLSAMHDPVSATCVAAERGVLVALEGDCKTPIAAYADRVTADAGPVLRLRAFIADPDGARLREGERTVPWPAAPHAEEDAHRVELELGAFLKAK
jgi:hydroxymethylbilane synthase